MSAFKNDTDGNNVGKAYVFDAVSGDLLQTFSDPTPTTSDEFGHFAALDGQYVVVGSPRDDTNGKDAGQAYLFDVATGELLHTFDSPSPDVDDRFGHSVWVDGENILIGEWGDDTFGPNVGQAYLFNANGELLQTFNDPTPTTTNEFSRELAMDGNMVLIGDLYDDTTGENVGQAHLFDAATGQLLKTFDDPTPTDGDSFGRSMSLDGNIVVIGAHRDSTLGYRVGQVHVFAISEISGDFDGDGVLDVDDINALSEASAGGLHELVFDLNDDGLVDQEDRRIWIHDMKNSFFGDSNLDGEFNSSDLVSVFQSGEYEDDISRNSTWATGDWNGDGEFGTADLVLAFQDGGFEKGPRVAVSAVPEPTGVWVATLAGISIATLFRRHRLITG